MNRTVKSSLAVFLSVGALVACNKLQWMVKYQDQDPYYSFSRITTSDTQGNAFIGGYIDTRPDTGSERIAFVAKYDATGNLVWDKRFDASNGSTPLTGVQALLADPQGNLYVSETRLSSSGLGLGLQVTKLNAAGEQQWQWYSDAFALYSWKMSLSLGADGNLYLRGGLIGAASLVSLTPEGELRWALPVSDATSIGDEAGDGSGGGLSDWPVRDLEQYSPAAQSPVTHSTFDWTLAGAGLRLVDLQGATLAEFSPQTLGLYDIRKVIIVADNVLVMGDAANNRILARLIRHQSGGFAFDAEKSLDVTGILHGNEFEDNIIAGHDDDPGFCFVARSDESHLTTGFVDAELQLVWSTAHETPHYEFPAVVMSVVGAGDACYTQYVESQDTQKLASVVLVENVHTGKQKERINVDQFAAYDLSVSGKNVFQAGITGPYSGVEGTAATLTKHSVN